MNLSQLQKTRIIKNVLRSSVAPYLDMTVT